MLIRYAFGKGKCSLRNTYRCFGAEKSGECACYDQTCGGATEENDQRANNNESGINRGFLLQWMIGLERLRLRHVATVCQCFVRAAAQFR